MTTRFLVLALGLAAAVFIDVRTRRIPNALTASMALTGVALAATAGNGITVAQSLLGMLVGFVLMLLAHVFGASGAGDLKLVTAIGALVGPTPELRVVLYTFVAGGAIALGVAAHRGLLATTFAGARQLVVAPAGAREVVSAPARGNRFAYAPAIALGTFVALVLG